MHLSSGRKKDFQKRRKEDFFGKIFTPNSWIDVYLA